MTGKVVNIIEDDTLILSNLTRYINAQSDLITGITSNSVEAYFEKLWQFPNSQYDALLLDIGLPGKSGLDALPEIKEKQPHLDIIMLTTFDEEKIVLQAMCNGAVAYITKQTPMAEIVDTIRTVLKGGSYMSPMVARDIFNYILKSKTPIKSNVLSKRQLQILKGFVDGNSYTTIAAELFISPETVRTHIKTIYKLLEVNNKTEAIKKYLAGYR